MTSLLEFKPRLTHVDLFAGIGGFRLALNHAGYTPIMVAACDTNSNSRKTYTRYFGDEYTHTDIRRMHLGSHLAPMPESGVDILTAGFPCQPFSKVNTSGKLGDDHKSGLLYLDMLRIIGECTPKVIVLENVGNFPRVDGGQQLGVILDSLESDYNITTGIFNTSIVVPQQRNRWILLAVRKDIDPDNLAIIIPSYFPTTRMLLADILDPIEDVSPLLYISKSSWSNLELKQTFAPILISREQAKNVSCLAPTLLATGQRGSQDVLIMEQNHKVPRVLSITEMIALMGFPHDIFRWRISNTAAHVQLGNSVVPKFIAEIINPTLKNVFT